MNQLRPEHITKALEELDAEQRHVKLSCGYNGSELATLDSAHYIARDYVAKFAHSLIQQLETDSLEPDPVEENATKAEALPARMKLPEAKGRKTPKRLKSRTADVGAQLMDVGSFLLRTSDLATENQMEEALARVIRHLRQLELEVQDIQASL